MPIEKFTYTVRKETVDGVARYYAAFTDGDGLPQETEIPREAYLALEDCRLAEKRQVNEVERHWERYELTEAQLAARTLRPPLPMEEAVVQTVDMQAALAALTETQRRRFLLYYEHGLTYEQIAQVEGCRYQVITRSVTAAITILKNFFDEGGVKQGSK